MNLTAYRITHARFAGEIFTGKGARDYGGRWNSKGVSVIYTSQSRSLAAMEQLVHLIQPRVLGQFVVASITFSQRQIARVDVNKLPTNWATPVAPASLRHFGDDWIALAKHSVLAVPSAVIPGEWNYLINPAHPEFEAMPKSQPEPFVYDERLK